MNPVVVAAVRSPVGRAKTGRLGLRRPDEVLAEVFRELLRRTAGVAPADIDAVVVGCAAPEFEQGLNIARVAADLAGLPEDVSAFTTQSHDLSSFDALSAAVGLIARGEARAVIVGGVDFQSRVPQGGFNPSLSPELAREMPDALTPPGLAAENLARKFSLSRAEQDRYAHDTLERALKADRAGFFDAERIPMGELARGVAEEPLVATSVVPLEPEDINPSNTDDTLARADHEAIQRGTPAFLEHGTITTGNCAPGGDGAAALLLADPAWAEEQGCFLWARLLATARTGANPALGGTAAHVAARKALKTARIAEERWADRVGWIEVHDAFAVHALAFAREFGIDDRRINPHGGSLAIGHAPGATGVRLLTTVIHGMHTRRDALALIAAAAFGGLGFSCVLERPGAPNEPPEGARHAAAVTTTVNAPDTSLSSASAPTNTPPTGPSAKTPS